MGLSGTGGSIHRGIQKKLLQDLAKLYPDKIVKAEGKIDLGNGKSRYGDVVVYEPSKYSYFSGVNNNDAILKVHQIGDLRTQGGRFRPSSRERGAIEDIRTILGDNVDIAYHDKKQQLSLKNPDLDKNWQSPKAKHRRINIETIDCK